MDYRVKICSDLLWRQHKKNNALSYGITAADFQNYHSPNWPEHHVKCYFPFHNHIRFSDVLIVETRSDDGYNYQLKKVAQP